MSADSTNSAECQLEQSVNRDVFVSDSHSTKSSEAVRVDQHTTHHNNTITHQQSHSTAAAREVRGSLPVPFSTSCHSQHGEQHDQGRYHHRAGQVWRTTSQDLVQDGDAHSDGGVASPSWNVSQSQGQASHTPAANGGSSQRSCSQEGRSGPVCDQRTGCDCGSQRHHQEHATERTGCHLRLCGSFARGSCGIRRALSTELPRADDLVCQVHRVGSGHLQGRSVLQQAGQACSLEPGPQGEGHQHGTLEGDQSSRTDPDGLHPGVQERQGRSFSDISRIRDLYTVKSNSTEEVMLALAQSVKELTEEVKTLKEEQKNTPRKKAHSSSDGSFERLP